MDMPLPGRKFCVALLAAVLLGALGLLLITNPSPLIALAIILVLIPLAFEIDLMREGRGQR